MNQKTEARETDKRVAPPETATVSEQAAADYLRAHPDFFNHHASLLAQLKVSHPSGDAVSLIERQVDLLRTQNRTLDRRLVDLVDVARSNDAVLERLHHLSLALLAVDEVSERIQVLDEHLRTHFSTESMRLLVFNAPVQTLGLANVTRVERDALTRFRRFLDENKPFCGHLRPAQLEYLFADQAPLTRSAALVPLGSHARIGLLALGSESSDHFSPMLGTVFLARIGELVEQILAPLLAQ